jgi:hypothetical protein
VLGDCGKNVYRETIGLGKVNGNEFNSGLHERRNEVDVTGEPINLGDNEDGAMQSAESEGVCDRRTIISLAALHLDHFFD